MWVEIALCANIQVMLEIEKMMRYYTLLPTIPKR